MTSSVFSHAVRVLVCDNCGAPLDADLDGGLVKCQYCDSTSQIVKRDESQDLADAEQSRGAAMSESERIGQLRAQDNQPLLPPPNLLPLLRGTELDPEHEDEARQLWLTARRRLDAGGGFSAGERLFQLTLLLAPVSEDRQERALLENGLEVLPDAGQRQVIRCRLAHKAVLAGDTQAAIEWLRPSNPRPTDLQMDTSFRVASAYVATAQGEYDQVLNLLGDEVDDLPIADGRDDEAALLRVNAIEHISGPDAATRHLKALLATDIRRLAGFEKSAKDNAPLELCQQSWPAVEKRALQTLEESFRAAMPSSVGCLALVALIIGVLFLVAVSAVIWNGETVHFAAVLAVALVVIVYVFVNQLRKARYIAANGAMGHARVLSAKSYLDSKTGPTYQRLELIIESQSGPVACEHRAKGEEPPAFGIYPCWYNPNNPASGFQVKLDGLELP